MKLTIEKKSITSKLCVLLFALCAGMAGLKTSFVDGLFLVYSTFYVAWIAYEEGISDVVRDTLKGKVKFIYKEK